MSFFLLIAAVFLISFALFSFFLSPSLPPTAPSSPYPPPPRQPSPISLQVPPPPPPTPLPLLRLFLPPSGQLLQLQHFCNPSFPHNSRETHTHTHTHTNAITRRSGKKSSSSCFCGGRKKHKTPLHLVETNSSSSFWRTKNCFVFFLVEAIGFLSLLLLQSLSFSLCVFHIIAEAFVVVLRNLFLSGEEARVAHVVLYTYGYIDRWIDAREDR